jgi:hypothetical protein
MDDDNPLDQQATVLKRHFLATRKADVPAIGGDSAWKKDQDVPDYKERRDMEKDLYQKTPELAVPPDPYAMESIKPGDVVLSPVGEGKVIRIGRNGYAQLESTYDSGSYVFHKSQLSLASRYSADITDPNSFRVVPRTLAELTIRSIREAANGILETAENRVAALLTKKLETNLDLLSSFPKFQTLRKSLNEIKSARRFESDPDYYRRAKGFARTVLRSLGR